MKRLYFFRHGETYANKAGILQGHLNTQLSPLGKRQARQLGHYSRLLPLDTIHTSDLDRAKATAEQISLHHMCSPIYTSQLRELSYGPLEGQSLNQLSQAHRQQLQQFYQDHIPLPYSNAESMQQLEVRLVSYIDSILTSPQHNHAIVSHGLAINCLIHSLLGWPTTKMQMLELTNCSVTELTFNGLRWQLVRLNQNGTSILKE